MNQHKHSFDEAVTRKLLRLLASLRRTESGSVLFRQVESLLNDLTIHHNESQDTQLSVINMLLEPLTHQLPAGSSLQMELQALRLRLKPPVTMADLEALHTYLDLFSDEFTSTGAVDAGQLKKAIEPLLQKQAEAFQQSEPADSTPKPKDETVADLVKEPALPEAREVEPALQVEPVSHAPDVSAPDAVNSLQESTEPTTGDEGSVHDTPIDNSSGESAQPDKVADALDEHADVSVDRVEVSAAHKRITDMPSGLAKKVMETISQNQEFGVLLELVENELRNVEDKEDIESLRWTIIREIEKLAREHQNLASNLDGTHQYLRMIETDSRQLSDELSRVRLLSLTDELTGLPNRRAFLRRLEDEVARVQRYGFPLSMALIDLDKFKEVNDEFGHAGGDEVLRIYSKNILSVFRHHDLVARYGGEEFAVLLANTSADGATRALNKVMKRASETRWQCNGQTISVPTFSAGLAFYKPGETTSGFIERVDQALYRAKRLGRNRVELDDTYAQGEDAVVTHARAENPKPRRES